LDTATNRGKARRGGRGGEGLSPPFDISTRIYAKTTTKLSYLFCDYNMKDFGTCNTLLERCFQDLARGGVRVLSQKYPDSAPNLKVSEQLQLQISLGNKVRKISSKSLSRGLEGSPTPLSKCSKWT